MSGFKVTWNDSKVLSDLARLKPRALFVATSEFQTDSNRYAPEEKGDLIRSSDVTIKGNKGALSYNEPYALRLHENPQFNFSKDKNPQAQGKWTERALRENYERYVQILATVLGGAF